MFSWTTFLNAIFFCFLTVFSCTCLPLLVTWPIILLLFYLTNINRFSLKPKYLFWFFPDVSVLRKFSDNPQFCSMLLENPGENPWTTGNLSISLKFIDRHCSLICDQLHAFVWTFTENERCSAEMFITIWIKGLSGHLVQDFESFMWLEFF